MKSSYLAAFLHTRQPIQGREPASCASARDTVDYFPYYVSASCPSLAVGRAEHSHLVGRRARHRALSTCTTHPRLSTAPCGVQWPNRSWGSSQVFPDASALELSEVTHRVKTWRTFRELLLDQRKSSVHRSENNNNNKTVAYHISRRCDQKDGEKCLRDNARWPS